MNNQDKQQLNTLHDLLDQVEELPPDEKEVFWNTLPEEAKASLEDLMLERRMMDGIASAFQENGVTSIQFGADDDPEGYKIDLANKRYE